MCQNWSLALTEESSLRVFENRVLSRILGSESDEVGGGWRRQQIVELNYLYFSPNIFWVIKTRKMRWAGHLAPIGESRGL